LAVKMNRAMEHLYQRITNISKPDLKHLVFKGFMFSYFFS